MALDNLINLTYCCVWRSFISPCHHKCITVHMLQGTLNTDAQVSSYSALPLYTTELHAVNYRKKYLCGEVLFCTLFIMKGMATRSTALPGKKQPCKESDTSYHIYHILQSYTTINLKIQELTHQNPMWSCFSRCHWWNRMTIIQSFNTRYSLDLRI
jgi:hypothetical protein